VLKHQKMDEMVSGNGKWREWLVEMENGGNG